jgi:hypothetical protein
MLKTWNFLLTYAIRASVMIFHPSTVNIISFVTWSWSYLVLHERHRRRPITHFEQNLSWLFSYCSIQINFVDESRYLRLTRYILGCKRGESQWIMFLSLSSFFGWHGVVLSKVPVLHSQSWLSRFQLFQVEIVNLSYQALTCLDGIKVTV